MNGYDNFVTIDCYNLPETQLAAAIPALVRTMDSLDAPTTPSTTPLNGPSDVSASGCRTCSIGYTQLRRRCPYRFTEESSEIRIEVDGGIQNLFEVVQNIHNGVERDNGEAGKGKEHNVARAPAEEGPVTAASLTEHAK
ncbi:hypothetical protein C0995_008129 [Termitomyces sp. Mi166|nr:hypothetical protein C0995_008129 [Termitomyces sp. Mi166\